MKSDGELMEILNAYDLTGSYRAVAELCGCSHHTVKKAVEDRDAGLPPAARRARMIDDWRDVLEGWVGESKGKIRGDKAHERLVALGYTGTDRTTRRALAEIKVQWRLGNTRVHRPWITEPGLWLQYDFADGPLVAGRKVVLVVGVVGVVGVEPVPGRDRIAGPDRTQCLRRTGPDLPDCGRRPDLPAVRQREDRHHRTHRRGPGPQPRGGHLRPLLRHLGVDLRTCRPSLQRGRGERGETRQSRHRAHRDEPAGPVRHLRRR